MNKEEIRNQLIEEVQDLLTHKYKRKPSKGLDALKGLANHFKGSEDFGNVITKTLNSILQKNEVKFESEEEKKNLITFLKPTITDLIRQYMLN